MVVHKPVDPMSLDLAHAALFLGLRVNELVVARGRRAGFRGFRERHGYVVQHLIESERSITELAERMEISQQAASKVVAELVALGYLEALRAKDRRQRRIRLSESGWRAVQFARRTRRTIDARLVKAVGARQYRQTKGIVLNCLDALGSLERIRARRIREPR